MNNDARPSLDTALVLDDAALDRLFLGARTHNGWQDRPVDDALLHRLYALTRMPPTSANTQPARFVFVKSAAAKERLRPAVMPMNLQKTMSAPVTVIVADDARFFEHVPRLVPHRPELADVFAGMPDAARDFVAGQSTDLQAGYLMLAARALGLDVGPMAGFDRAAVDAAFLAGTPWRSRLLINLGYGDPAALYPRAPRLDFADACRID